MTTGQRFLVRRDDLTQTRIETFDAAAQLAPGQVRLRIEHFAFTANTAVKFGLFAGNWGAWYDGNFLDHVEAVDDYTAKIFYHTRPGMARW